MKSEQQKTKQALASMQCAKAYAALHTNEWYETEGSALRMRCSACGKEGGPELFWRARYSSRGYGSRCKSCHGADNSNRKFIKRYGISSKERESLWLIAGKTCQICSRDLSKGKFHIDHCHASGKVRGVLCGPCNHAIGLLQDSPEIAELLAAYLRKDK